jgi:hypothetical protein
MIEFIGEYLYLRSAMLAFTEKRFEVPERFKTGAMAAWSIHRIRLFRCMGFSCSKGDKDLIFSETITFLY